MKVAILERDADYLKHIREDFCGKFSQKIDLLTLTEEEAAYDALAKTDIDVFLASDEIDVNVKKIPNGCGFAYLTEDNDTNETKGYRAFGKYRKADELMSDLEDIFEKKDSVVLYIPEIETKIVAFIGASGGAGNSTIAAAYATRRAGMNEKVLYMNVEGISSAGCFFETADVTDRELISTAVCEEGEFARRLADILAKDESGVFTLTENQIAEFGEIDILEVAKLVITIKEMKEFDCVVMDIDKQWTKGLKACLENCDSIVFLSDATEISNQKLAGLIDASKELGEKRAVIYNRFDTPNAAIKTQNEIRVLGGIKCMSDDTAKQRMKTISRLKMFDMIAKKEQI